MSGSRIRLVIAVLLLGAAGPAAVRRPATGRKVLPGYERQRARFDAPDEAQRFFLAKRSPDGVSPILPEWYLEAQDRMREMPRSSLAEGRTLPPRRASSRVRPEAQAPLGPWKWLGPGNVGGRTRALVLHPSDPATLYAGAAAGGIWKSTDSGATWRSVGDLLPNQAVCALAIEASNPAVIYAGTGEGYFNADAVRGAGIFKSTDAGASWTRLAATSDFFYVNRIVASPSTPGRVYAATRDGIYRSPDGGASWTLVYLSSTQVGVTDLAIRTDRAQDVLFATETGAILRNSDAGGSAPWTKVYTEAGLGRSSLAIAPSNQDVVYALGASRAGGTYQDGLLGVFRSTDGGSTWSARVRNTDATRLNTLLLTNAVYANLLACHYGPEDSFLNQGWYDNVIAVDPADENRVWTGGIDLFRSDDGGSTWGLASYWFVDPDSGSPYAHADQHVLLFHPAYDGAANQTLWVGDDGGIFRTDNARAATSTDVCGNRPGTIRWTNLNNGYGATQFYHGLPLPDGKAYFGGTQDNGTVIGLDSLGPNGWFQINGGDGGYVAVEPGNAQVLYSEYTGRSIQKSTDGGGTWKAAVAGITASDSFLFIAPFLMDPTNPGRLWTGGSLMWRTSDGAASWLGASATLGGGSGSVSAIAVSKADPDYVLAGTSNGFIHATQSGVTSTLSTVWPSARPAPGGYVSWLEFDPVDRNTAWATISRFNFGHVWRTTDAGASWTNRDGSGAGALPDVPAHCILVDPSDSKRLFLGTDLGVFTSTDAGGSWAVEATGFGAAVTEALAIRNGRLYAFTHGRGAYRVALDSCVDRTIGQACRTVDTANPAGNPVLVPRGH